jgi:hypothetical protein
MTNALRILRESPVLVTGAILGLILAAGDLISGASAAHAAIALAIVLGWGLLVTVVGRRSETFSVLAGRPVDERWEHINLEATAIALGASALVVLFLVVATEVMHGDPLPYVLVGTLIGASYLAAVAWLRLRG